jgi:PPOX class probable F420-dependent enzyme
MALKEMTPEIRAFLAETRIPGVLSTLGLRGEPITSAVWYGLDGDDVIVATPATRNKARNVRNDPRVSFLVDTKEQPYRGVAIEGIAELAEDPELELMYGIAHRYLGPVLPEAIRQRYATSERVIIRIRARRIRPWNIPALT